MADSRRGRGSLRRGVEEGRALSGGRLLMNAVVPPVVKTACPYCGVGCGVDVTPTGLDSAEVRGDKAHPANHGKLCVKGSALGETLSLEGRLLHPMIHGQRATWNQAAGFVAEGLRRTLDEHGPGAVAFYLSGQLLTEDYYLANKFAKGFLGTGHVDTNSRLCMASSVAGHRRAFGLGHGAQPLRRSRRGRPDRAGRLETPRGAIRFCSSACRERSGGAARGSSTSIRAARRRARAPICSSRSSRAWIRFCSLPAGQPRRARGGRPPYVEAHVAGFDLALAARVGSRPTSP